MSDAPLNAHEHREHAEHAAHANDPFISRVSITIGILAVLAAATGSLENYESAAAIIAANEATLDQDRANDAWNLFESRSLKKNMFQIAADAGANTEANLAKAHEEAKGQADSQADAKRLEEDRDASMAKSDAHEHRHHRLAIAATLIEVGIAVSTIAIVTRRRGAWICASLLGLAGAAVAASAYLF